MAVPLTTIEGSDDLYTSITVPPGAGRIKEMRFALCNRITVIDKESLINRVGILPIQVTDEILKQLREILVL
jgi:mRNA-degrading endonuclease toxin of MazEF toxin-antitoxin module